MVAEQGLPAVIVNPSTPIGPRDKADAHWPIIVEAANGKAPGLIDTGLNLVHVDDVADGHIAALERGKVGERTSSAARTLELSRLFADIAERVGGPPRSGCRAKPPILLPFCPKPSPRSPARSRARPWTP